MSNSAASHPHPQPAGIREEDDMVQRRTLRDYYIMLRERVWIALPLALLVSVSYGYWKSRFASDPAVIGRELLLNDRKLTVVGVAQPGFRGTERLFPTQVFVPVTVPLMLKLPAPRTVRPLTLVVI